MATLKENIAIIRRNGLRDAKIVKDQATGTVARLAAEAMNLVTTDTMGALTKLREGREAMMIAKYCEQVETVLGTDPFAPPPAVNEQPPAAVVTDTNVDQQAPVNEVPPEALGRPEGEQQQQG